jgi:hypothetical protein
LEGLGLEADPACEEDAGHGSKASGHEVPFCLSEDDDFLWNGDEESPRVRDQGHLCHPEDVTGYRVSGEVIVLTQGKEQGLVSRPKAEARDRGRLDSPKETSELVHIRSIQNGHDDST